jgi:anti-sigma factor RsiW
VSEAELMLRCEDVHDLAHLYVDGELEGDDRVALDRHAGRCGECEALLREQAAFKSMLRQHLCGQPGQAVPEALRARLSAALDQADARGLGPRRSVLGRAAPYLAMAGVAGAAFLFVLNMQRPPATAQAPSAGPALVNDAVRAHERHLPVEVGGSPEKVSTWMKGKVSVPVRPPELRPGDQIASRAGATQAGLIGGRLSHLSSREAAQLSYRVGGYPLSLYVFDASDLALVGLPAVRVGTHNLYVTRQRGYSVVIAVEGDDGENKASRGPLGYVFASEMPEAELLELAAHTMRSGHFSNE